MNKKSLFIPFKEYQSIGGPSTFMRNLKTCLDDNHYPYLEDHQKADAIFFPISFDKNILAGIKKKKGPIIQRLDGIYYPSKHGDKYIELNKDIEDIYKNYADFIVFQSEYSKKQCFEMFGEKKEDEYTIILNGTDKTIFYPSKENKELSEAVKFITTGNFRNRDMIEPVINALDKLKDSFKFQLNVAGPITDDLKDLFRRDYIKISGKMDLHEVAKLLRESDIFIYSHLNPPCPNSVIEAISCGLPVVGFKSGAMSELLFFAEDLLAEVSDNTFQQYEDFYFNKLADKIVLAVENHEHYQRTALEQSGLYSFEECGIKYIQCFSRIKEKPSFIRKIFGL